MMPQAPKPPSPMSKHNPMRHPFKSSPVRDLVMAKLEKKILEAELKYVETVKQLDQQSLEEVRAIWQRLEYEKVHHLNLLADSILP